MATIMVPVVTAQEIASAFGRAKSTDSMVTMHDGSTRRIWCVLPNGRITVREHTYAHPWYSEGVSDNA